MKYYSIREAALLLGVSRSYVYHLIGLRKLKAEKIGAQYVVTIKELQRYKVAQNPSQSGLD